MSEIRRSDLGVHFLDTGPLLCLGGSDVIADLYDETLLVDARAAEAVAKEVRRRGAEKTPNGDPQRRGQVNRAARAAVGRYFPLLESAIPVPNRSAPQFVSIKAKLMYLATQKNGDKQIHPNANDGEAESIHVAKISSANFVTGDNDARFVAKQNGVYCETFVDLASRLSRAQRQVKTKRIFGELQRLAKAGIDIGDRVSSHLDLIRVDF